jgi:hypothetical protein
MLLAVAAFAVCTKAASSPQRNWSGPAVKQRLPPAPQRSHRACSHKLALGNAWESRQASNLTMTPAGSSRPQCVYVSSDGLVLGSSQWKLGQVVAVRPIQYDLWKLGSSQPWSM